MHKRTPMESEFSLHMSLTVIYEEQLQVAVTALITGQSFFQDMKFRSCFHGTLNKYLLESACFES